jgi:uncharacterized protein involved in tolerance to divalent cations/ketosteroid isomerase-like protein
MTMLAVFTTVAGMDDARRLAAQALDQGLAACVQLSTIESHFRWQGRVQCEPEVRLLFKTEAARYAALERWLLAQHRYELPAIFALPVDRASAGYADWVRQAVATPGGEALSAALMPASAESVVRAFWQLMASNDFDAVGAVLAPGFVLEWPQSGERIRGAENFARVNSEYPSHGRWRFTVQRVVAQGPSVVTQVGVTDGVRSAEAISFFSVEDGRISRIVEYWPDPFEPRPERRHRVERMANPAGDEPGPRHDPAGGA